MAVTRKEKLKLQKDQLMYVIKEVLFEEEDSNIAKALNSHGCESMRDLIGLLDKELHALDFKNDDGDIIELKTFKLSKLRLFQEYFRKCLKEGYEFKNGRL